MHEMSLAEGIVQIVKGTARANDARAVRAVWLELGALSHIEREALRFSFDVVKRGTVAQDARLEVITTPGRAWCMPCGEAVDLGQLGDPCPTCGSYQLQVTQGEEMRAGPQLAQHLDGLIEALAAGLEFDADGVELFLHPAGAGAEAEAPLTQTFDPPGASGFRRQLHPLHQG